MEKQLAVKISTAAQRLDVDASTIRRYIRQGKLTATTGKGRERKVTVASLEAYARGEAPCQDNANAPRTVTAASIKKKTVVGGRKSIKTAELYAAVQPRARGRKPS